MSVKFAVLLTFSFILYVCGLNKNPSIIIIGSGPSGIAAATKLWKNNFTNVRILEAENRIGGRVNSVKFGDGYIDMGGQWCHGEKGNIVYDMVKEYDILRHSNISVQVYYSNGTLLDQEVSHNWVEFSESIYANINDTETEERCGNISSIGGCFDSLFNSTFIELYKNNPDLQTISVEAEEWIKSYMRAEDSCFTLHDLARRSNYKTCEGDIGLNWDGRGYKTILELMLQQYPDPSQELSLVNNIFLNKEVTKIYWGRNQVEILCLDNTTYTVDHVIFTASLGVLKANHESLFVPALPEEKVKVIRNIGFGAVMKIILHFPHTWWDITQTYGFVWSAADRENILTEFGRGPVKNGRSWLTTTAAFITPERNPKVLLGFFTGDMIPEMEQETDEVLIAGCMYMFKKFLGGTYSNITDADYMIKSTWYSNPHFRGSYSYESSNSTERGLPNRLAAPLTRENRNLAVLFAGEATHPYYYSTVHGAIESGYREADRLINYYARQ